LIPWIVTNPNFFYLLIGDNQCEARVVDAKENSMAATNNELEKAINDKMEMTSNPSDVEEAKQTKDMVQDMV
jgi:hypothetical protein